MAVPCHSIHSPEDDFPFGISASGVAPSVLLPRMYIIL